MCTGSKKLDIEDALLRVQVTDYLEACKQRIPGFIETHFSRSGAVRLNGRAWGIDILVAPFNFLMGFPNFLLRLSALLLEYVGARKAAWWMVRRHLGFSTTVQQTLQAKLMTDLLELPVTHPVATERLRRLITCAAREPVRIYVQARNVAADITAGTLAAVAGLAFFSQFTPGSISTGSVIAQVIAKETAVSAFVLGETLGRWYYAVFPVDPSPAIIVATLLIVMATLAIVAAFSGIVHDPIQALTGIHKRRLSNLLNAIEEAIHAPTGKGYRPKDTFFGRVYDVMDWIKGLLSFS